MKTDYSTYQIQDFLEDKHFKEWVAAGAIDAVFKQSIIEKYPFQKENIELARVLLQNLKYVDLSKNNERKDTIWLDIEQKIQSVKSSKIVMWKWVSAGAATILLFIVSQTFLRKENLSFETPLAQKQVHSLPDGSIITMNSDSKIEYDVKKFNSKRLITLKGEAFFEVKKGSTFTIKTDQGEVKVIGTSFNIYSRDDWMEVKCYTGKVSVLFHSKKEQYLLIEGQSIKNFEENNTTNNFEVDLDKDWRTDHFYYKDVPFTHVLHEFQRQFAIKELEVPKDIQNYKYSGYFHKNNLEQAIQSVCLPLQLEGKIVNGKMILTKKE